MSETNAWSFYGNRDSIPYLETAVPQTKNVVKSIRSLIEAKVRTDMNT